MEQSTREGLVGNRWVLVGGIVYLLEWVAIIWIGVLGIGETVIRGASAADLSDAYAGHDDALTSMAGWFAVVLVFRVLVFIGLRRALADSGYQHALLDFAVAAAVVSSTLEIASYGLGGAAASLAQEGNEETMLAVDQAAAGVNLMLFGGLGLAITCAAYCMWQSGLFSRVLCTIGLVSGVAVIAAQLSVAPSLQTPFDILFTFALLFWTWMLWTGVVCWRRTPRQARQERAASLAWEQPRRR